LFLKKVLSNLELSALFDKYDHHHHHHHRIYNNGMKDLCVGKFCKSVITQFVKGKNSFTRKKLKIWVNNYAMILFMSGIKWLQKLDNM